MTMVSRAVVMVAWCGATMVGCGEEEAPPTAREICTAENKAVFVSGQLDLNSNGSAQAVEIEPALKGAIRGDDLFVVFAGAAAGDDLVLKLSDNGGGRDMINELSTRFSAASPASLTVSDASEVPSGSENVTSLDGFSCALEASGALCAQAAVDVFADELITDEDRPVFNASGGEVVVTEIRGLQRRLTLNFAIDFNADSYNRDTGSVGRLEGCLDVGYELDGGDTYTLVPK